MKLLLPFLTSAFLLASAFSSAQAATWTVQTGATITQGRPINDIWGASDTAVWGVGGTASNTELWKWNGTTWAAQSTGAAANHAAVWGVDANNVWVVGRGGRIDKTSNGGTNWTQQASGLPSTALIRGIWGTSATNIWAVAGDFGDNTIVYITHYDGTSWTQYTPTTSFSGGLRSVWGTSATDIWAVGDLGNRLHYDGTSWTSVPTGLSTTGLYKVWGLDASNIWIIGDNATLLKHSSGLTWTTFSNTGITSTDQLRGITGSSATNLYVVTNNGAQNLYHFDGTSWAVENSTVSVTLVSLWSTNNATKLWAGGTPVIIAGTAAAQQSGVAVTSLVRSGATPSNASSVSWTLTFPSAVTGVTATNFSLSGAAATGSSIGTPTTANSGVTWTIPVTTGSTDGTLTLTLANATGLSQTVSNVPFGGESYTIDKTAPTVQSVTRLTPAGQTTNLTTVIFRVTYSEPVTLNSPATARFSVVPINGSTVVASVTGVTGTGNTRDVTVNVTSGTGEFRLRVID